MKKVTGYWMPAFAGMTVEACSPQYPYVSAYALEQRAFFMNERN